MLRLIHPPTTSPAARTNVWIAAAPLAVLVLARAAAELEALLVRSRRELDVLERAIAARTAALNGPYVPDVEPAVTEPAGGPESAAPPCNDCDSPAAMRSASGVPYCAEHDRTVIPTAL